jgi:hypothetical protein
MILGLRECICPNGRVKYKPQAITSSSCDHGILVVAGFKVPLQSQSVPPLAATLRFLVRVHSCEFVVRNAFAVRECHRVVGVASVSKRLFPAADLVLPGDLGFLLVDFEIDHRGLDAGDTEKTPADGHEFVEEIPVDEGFGLELEDIALAEDAEVLLGLVREDGAAGVEAVGDGGGVRTGAALGGFGTVREGAVGAGSIDSTS